MLNAHRSLARARLAYALPLIFIQLSRRSAITRGIEHIAVVSTRDFSLAKLPRDAVLSSSASAVARVRATWKRSSAGSSKSRRLDLPENTLLRVMAILDAAKPANQAGRSAGRPRRDRKYLEIIHAAEMTNRKIPSRDRGRPSRLSTNAYPSRYREIHREEKANHCS